MCIPDASWLEVCCKAKAGGSPLIDSLCGVTGLTGVKVLATGGGGIPANCSDDNDGDIGSVAETVKKRFKKHVSGILK